jgi:APA family basic amino acid/polyamine antiporter
MADSELKRALGVPGAVMLGLGSILGTGVFVSIGIAADVAAAWVLPAVVIAAFVATCNGLSSAQLAADHPVSGGTYEYGYKYLHPKLGFIAGWLFMTAKSASAATAALGFAGYLLGLFDQSFGRWVHVGVALGVVLLFTVLVLSGLRRTNWVNITIVSVTIAVLVLFIVRAGLELGSPFAAIDTADGGPRQAAYPQPWWQHLFHASALMFVAYTGYGRIATLGEEIREPRKKIPAAIIVTLIVSALLYIAVAFVVTRAQMRMADDASLLPAPLEAIARMVGGEGHWLVWIVTLGALTAMLGVLLNLILGLSRVLLAMGRRADVPRRFGKLGGDDQPRAAIVMVAIIIGGLALIGDVKLTWTFSAFTVLGYYALTNLACLRLPVGARLYPRVFAWCGLISCLSLAFFVPWRVWAIGLGWIAVGLIWHVLATAAGRAEERSL